MPYNQRTNQKKIPTYKEVMDMKNEAASAADLYDKDQDLRFLFQS